MFEIFNILIVFIMNYLVIVVELFGVIQFLSFLIEKSTKIKALHVHSVSFIGVPSGC